MKTVKSKLLLYAMGCVLFVGSTTAHAVNSYSGRAFVLQVKVVGLTDLTLVDTGELPSTGGIREASLPTINLLGIVADLLHAKTKVGEGGRLATSFARTGRFGLDVALPVLPVLPLLGGLLDVSGKAARARARARCVNGLPQLSGRSVVTNLKVLGVPIRVTLEPNQTIDVLGLVKVIINEQVRSIGPFGDTGAITVNAVHITVADILPILPPVAEVIVASAHADITCN
ncbi:MAG: choice-of-anchor P family protein [Gammaproteobacteria bacterium]